VFDGGFSIMIAALWWDPNSRVRKGGNSFACEKFKDGNFSGNMVGIIFLRRGIRGMFRNDC